MNDLAQRRQDAALPRSLACWCGGGPDRPQFRTRRFGLVRCAACGCFRIDPPPISREEEGAGFYTEYYATEQFTNSDSEEDHETPRRDSRFWRVVEQFPELEKPGDAVADIGCGEGGLCAELRAAGWQRVVGFDLSSTRIGRARKKYPGIEFHDSAFPGGQIGNASLDLVTMDNVLEHMPDPVSSLRSVAKSLKPSGRLALITPNMRSGHYRLLGRRWTPELSPHAHIFLFTPASLERLLTMCGFLVERIGTYQWMRYPVSLMWRQWRRGEYKEAVWHAVQEAGSLYSRVIGSGPMVWAVARPRCGQ